MTSALPEPSAGTALESLFHARELQRSGRRGKARRLCQKLLDHPVHGPAAGALDLLCGNPGEDRIRMRQTLEEKFSHINPLDSSGISGIDGQTLGDIGGGHLLAGNALEAEAFLRQAVALCPCDGVLFNRLGMAQAVLSKHESALASFKTAYGLRPDEKKFLLHQARILVRTGQVRKALAIASAFQDKRLGQTALAIEVEALLALGRTDRARDRIQGFLQTRKPHPGLLRMAAQIAGARDKFREADGYYRQALAISPDHTGILLDFSRLLRATGQYGELFAVLGHLSRLAPDRPELWVPHVLTAMRRNRYDIAMAQAERVKDLTRGKEGWPRAEALCARAVVRHESGEVQKAETGFRKALEMDPSCVNAMRGLGKICLETGRLDQAVSLFEKMTPIHPKLGYSFLMTAKALPDDPGLLSDLETWALTPNPTGSASPELLFLVAQTLDRKREYDRAFALVKKANALKALCAPYDADGHTETVSRTIGVFSPAFMEKRAGWGNPSAKPVFVVGMPRSGTSLVEQILAGHSRIFGAGELGKIPAWAQGITLWTRQQDREGQYPEAAEKLTRKDVADIAGLHLSYLDSLARDADLVVDKLPHNFMHIGMIKLVFPNARIIHCQRDVRDTAVSNFFQDYEHFVSISFAYDLEALGRHLLDYQRIMAHWNTLFADSILNMEYEGLIRDPEARSRQMLAHLGMDWEPGVLDFQNLDRPVKTASVWQVRQPIYTSSAGRWKNYEAFLGPLNRVLATRSHC